MKTAGERQYFAIALLLKLFKYLPTNLSVGVMYDIACQLERSCRKWNFLPAYLPRILWAVSVFHAYGHQWACQLIYHPRKRIGFGLTDGEGCERFWSAIEFLIPILRVSGVSTPCSNTVEQSTHLLTVPPASVHARPPGTSPLRYIIGRSRRMDSPKV